MDKLKELYQSFIGHLKRLMKSLTGPDGEVVDDVDKALIEQARTDEERETIAEICAEVNMEHELLDEMLSSGKEPGEWLEDQIEEVVREAMPEATQEDIDKVKDAVRDGMEEDLAKIAVETEKEVDAIESSEQTK